MAIIADCLSVDGSSILPRVAKFLIPPLAQWQSNRLITDRQKFNSSTEDQVLYLSGVMAALRSPKP